MAMFTRALLGALSALAVCAAPAHAALVSTTTDCGEPPAITQPFGPWGDGSDYKLVDPFESGTAGWALTGAAGVVAGNEPFLVHGASDAASLSVPAGSVAVSPPVCVGHGEPTLRLFARG